MSTLFDYLRRTVKNNFCLIPLPAYDTVGRDGPAHAPEFTIRVSVQGYGETTGTGKSKRIAEQDAAGKMIAKLNG